MKTNSEGIPHLLPQNKDGSWVMGDNKNSWIGVALLQELFVKEHNWIADQIAKEYPDLEDPVLFDHARNVVASLVHYILDNRVSRDRPACGWDVDQLVWLA